jgi:hypothetical protein
MTIATTSAAKHCKPTPTDAEARVATALPGRVLVDLKRPAETAAQLLGWPHVGPGHRCSRGRRCRRQRRLENSIRGPVRGGPRDRLILSFTPDARDLGKVIASLRQAF